MTGEPCPHAPQCNWRKRTDRGPLPEGILHMIVESMCDSGNWTEDEVVMLTKGSARYYVRDICVRCGRTAERVMP